MKSALHHEYSKRCAPFEPHRGLNVYGVTCGKGNYVTLARCIGGKTRLTGWAKKLFGVSTGNGN